MSPEYQVIADRLVRMLNIVSPTLNNVLENEIANCERLASKPTKPTKPISDERCREIWETVWNGRFDSEICKDSVEVVRKIIAGYESAQHEPVEVPFDFEKWNNGGWQAMLCGKDVSFVVPVALHVTYTMRRK